MAGQNQSRWLREEDDDTWETRIGGESNSQHQPGGNFLKKGKEIIEMSNYREVVGLQSRTNVSKTNSLSLSKN